MPIVVRSRRRSEAKILQEFEAPIILDVTSRGPDPWVKLSPFFPHGGIPVPFSAERVGASVEGIWQGLKVFESADVDPSKLHVTSMKGLKRTVRRFGSVLGHRRGFDGDTLLGYVEARRAIYLPVYLWVLEQRLKAEVAELRDMSSKDTVVLLDYETNTDVDDPRRPLSHAGLVAAHVEERWPA